MSSGADETAGSIGPPDCSECREVSMIGNHKDDCKRAIRIGHSRPTEIIDRCQIEGCGWSDKNFCHQDGHVNYKHKFKKLNLQLELI